MPTTNLKSKGLASSVAFTGTSGDELLVSDPNSTTLDSLLAQMKITNLHLSLLTDNTFLKGESE